MCTCSRPWIASIHVQSFLAECPPHPPDEGSLRLRGGLGTPCDFLHSGFVDFFHEGEWGGAPVVAGTLAADVACRQLVLPARNTGAISKCDGIPAERS